MEYEALGIVFDDLTLKEDDTLNDWSQICEACRLRFGLTDNEYYTIDLNSGNGYCGVKGCWNEADHYIDFVDDIVKEIEE